MDQLRKAFDNLHLGNRLLPMIKLDNPLFVIVTSLVLFLSWLYFNHTKSINKSIPVATTEQGNVVETTTEDAAEDYRDELTQLKEEFDEDDYEEIKKVHHLNTNDTKSVKQYVTRLRTKTYKLQLSRSEKEREEEAKRQQLAQICALLNKDKELFGETSLENVEQQLAMYVQ